MEVPVKSIIFIFIIIIVIVTIIIIIIIIIIITFIAIQGIGFMSHFQTGRHSWTQILHIDFIYVLQTLEMTNVDLELNYLHLLITNFDN